MKPTLLIVDDEPVAALTLAKVFERNGYRVLSAPTAQRALALVASESVDVVIMDDQLEGAQPLGRGLKNQHPSLPLVVFSSVPINPDAASFADAFVPKPENPRLLLQRIATLLRNGQQHTRVEEWDKDLPKAA